MGQHSDSCKPSCNDSHDWQDPRSSSYWGGPQYSDDDPRNSGCFPASALVETPTGKIPIGQLVEGDMVMSVQDGKLVVRHITHKRSYPSTSLCQVLFESGTKVIATGSHSFLTPAGWRQLSNLEQGDLIEQISSGKKVSARIHAIKPVPAEPVFNLYTAGEHNFIVDGCIVHNFTYLRGFRTFLHNILFDDVPAVWA